MQRLTLIAAAAVFAALNALSLRAGAQAFRPRPSPQTVAASPPVGPALAGALDSLRAVARRLRVREAELGAQLALLHRDAVERALDRDGRPTRDERAAAMTAEEWLQDIRLRRDLFYTALAAGTFANQMWQLDPDDYRGPRPAVDRYTGYHFTAGVTLEQLGFVMRVPSGWRVAGVCAAAELFEHTQGYADHVDAAVGCAGAALSAAARWAFAGR